MSDPKSSYGEPVEEPTSIEDDVVGRAQAGLADAEAAGREATDAPVVTAPADTTADEAPSAANDWAAEPPAWASSAVLDDEPALTAVIVDEPATSVYDEKTTAYEPVVAPSEPVVAPVVSSAPQPIFVQAPEAPRPRGNRGAAGAIGLLAALAFAVLYLAASLGFAAVAGDVTVENLGTSAVTALTTWGLWIPTVVFFLAFWLLGAIINRGRWAVWVIVGIVVGVAAYGGHLLGQLFEAPFWLLTARQGAELIDGQLFAPLAIAAFVFGRELAIWFGAWVSARGKRVTEINIEAQREYERTLEAGPQLVRQ